MAITRRRLLATGVHSTAALALAGLLGSTGALAGAAANIMTLYDPRFPRSRSLASALPHAVQLLAVRGDPSPLLAQIGFGANRRSGVHLQGVTTESIPFCLEQFVCRDREVICGRQRLDCDLFAWSLVIDAGPRVA